MTDIRRATPDDIDSLVALETAAFPMPWSRGQIAACFEARYDYWLLVDGQVLLAALLMQCVCDEAEILSLGVCPTHQRRGYGKQLLRHGIDEALSRECEKVFLEVQENNFAAVQLYLQAGFEGIGRRLEYYETPDGDKEDALVLVKNLAQKALPS
jgi:ribosomal-protein-alanine N-acetyltransferase